MDETTFIDVEVELNEIEVERISSNSLLFNQFGVLPDQDNQFSSKLRLNWNFDKNTHQVLHFKHFLLSADHVEDDVVLMALAKSEVDDKVHKLREFNLVVLLTITKLLKNEVG